MGASSPLLNEEQEDAASIGREWRVQQVGWVVLTVIIVLALAGVFGAGPLSWASASAADRSLTVDYPRFARAGGGVALRLRVAPSAAVDGQARVSLSHELLGGLELRQITPQPESQISTGEGVVFVFALEGDLALEAAREKQGLERLDQVKFAVLERSGGISIIPR